HDHEKKLFLLPLRQTPFQLKSPTLGLDLSSLQVGQIMGEIKDVGVGYWIHHISHRGVVAASCIALVLAQRLHEVVLALAGQAWNVLYPGKILLMAEVAPVLLDQWTRPFELGGIWRFGGGQRRRQLRKQLRHAAYIIIAETLGHLVHWLDNPHPFA